MYNQGGRWLRLCVSISDWLSNQWTDRFRPPAQKEGGGGCERRFGGLPPAHWKRIVSVEIICWFFAAKLCRSVVSDMAGNGHQRGIRECQVVPGRGLTALRSPSLTSVICSVGRAVMSQGRWLNTTPYPFERTAN